MDSLVDADSASLFLRGNEILTRRVLEAPPGSVWLSGIAAEEILEGCLARINTVRSTGKGGLRQAYDLLIRVVALLSRFDILPYDDDAEAFVPLLAGFCKACRKT
jgi:predicted nucleic acid-binding protein